MFLSRLLLSSALLFSLSYATESVATALNETKAIEFLGKKIAQSKVYGEAPQTDCLRFYTEGKTRQYFDIRVYEKHGEECAMESEKPEIEDRFRVYRKSHKVLWRKPESEDFLSFNQFIIFRTAKHTK
jgi:hypothetical protein